MKRMGLPEGDGILQAYLCRDITAPVVEHEANGIAEG